MLSIIISITIIAFWLLSYFKTRVYVDKRIDKNEKLKPYLSKLWFRFVRFSVYLLIAICLYYLVAGGVIMVLAVGWTVLAKAGVLSLPKPV